MRAIIVLLAVSGAALAAIGAPQAGVLAWTWLTLMTPHKLAWGFVTDLPLNQVVAIATLIGWGLSREPKRIPVNAITVLWLSFIVWTTFTTTLALAPERAWVRWEWLTKTIILAYIVAGVMTNKVRLHALVWVMALSLGYFGVKGGGFTLLTGGHSHVLGPEESGLGDNNALALALCMTLPLMNYLRLQSQHYWIRLGLMAAMGLTTVAVLGTYSRGGLIGILIMGIFLWTKSKRKVLFASLALAVLVPAIHFMPEQWMDRMHTIQSADKDESFEGRVLAWHFALNVARARPYAGAGFDGTNVGSIYNSYSPDPSVIFLRGKAAHSIYFEVLGDHGPVGLIIFLGLLLAGWRCASEIRKRSRGQSSLAWATDLATMIQVSLVTYMVAGAALSMAYYDMFYLFLGILVSLREILVKEQAVSRNAANNSFARFNSTPPLITDPTASSARSLR